MHDLLTDSGSIIVQIGEENTHRVRALLDEVFGSENVVASIIFTTTSSQGANLLPVINDTLLWFCKDKSKIKYRQLFEEKVLGG